MKNKFIWMMVLTLLITVMSYQVFSACGACSPSSCPSGYTEVSCSCSNKVCARVCEARLCTDTITGTWTDNDPNVEWNRGTGYYEESDTGGKIGGQSPDRYH